LRNEPPKKPKPLPTSFRLTIEYDGGRYNGWQRQGLKQSAAGVKTVSAAIDRVLYIAGLKILHLAGAGRTDAGVHALGQVACLHLAQPIKPSELHRILDQGLPYDIAVPSLEPCPPDFDPRRDALSRTYLYQIALRKSAFAKNYTWWPKLPLDLDLIHDAWAMFEGNHSMEAFADLEDGENPLCQIYNCESKVVNNILLLRATARFFLRKQARRMVGAVVHCAMGNAKIGQIKASLKSPSPSAALFWAERAAPASGLFLESVTYRSGEGAKEFCPVLKID
jgi:tRNA pseudouridine38-40 synthase